MLARGLLIQFKHEAIETATRLRDAALESDTLARASLWIAYSTLTVQWRQTIFKYGSDLRAGRVAAAFSTAPEFPASILHVFYLRAADCGACSIS